MKVYYERIFPKATSPGYRYLFGVIYPLIGERMGISDITEIHELLKLKFNVVFEPLPHSSEFIVKIMSGTEWSVISIAEYIEKVSSWAEVEFPGLYIPSSDEV